jgi:hypothetical protein
VSPYLNDKVIWRYGRNKTAQELRNVITAVSSSVPSDGTGRDNSVASPTKATASEVVRVPLQSRLAENYEAVKLGRSQALEKKQVNALAAIINSDKGLMELQAKLTGLLNERPVTNVLIVSGDAIQGTYDARKANPDEVPPVEHGTIDLAPDDYTLSQ